MKRAVFISLMVLSISRMAFADAGAIAVYTSCDASNCNIVDDGGLVTVYIVHAYTDGAMTSQFKLDAPPEWTHIDDDWNFLEIGTSISGVSLAYGECLSGAICLGSVTFLGSGVPYCTEIGIVADPTSPSGFINVIDCYDQRIYATGGRGFVNGDPSPGPCWCSPDPRCSVEPTAIEFGTVSVGGSNDMMFTITNLDVLDMEGTVGESCSHYGIVSGGGPYSLMQNQSLQVTVRFAPLAPGSLLCAIETGQDRCTDVFVRGFGCPATSRLYVDKDATGLGDGASWTDAMTDLQTALSIANECPVVTAIWVAEGTYKPTSGSDRNISFALQNDLTIYGGFAGTETAVTQREMAKNPTILSGDIGTVGDNSDNSYHVVVGSYVNSTAVLDGFVVTDGNAGTDGGGMYNVNGSPVVRNVTFRENEADDGGAGVYNDASSPTLTNVAFINNAANSRGGGLFNTDGSNAVLTNVCFSGNSASIEGGGIYNSNSSNPTFVSTIIYNNFAATGGEIYNDGTSTPTISYSLVGGSGGSGSWDTALGTDGGNNIDADPQFVGPFVGDVRLLGSSPAIDAGDNAAANLPATDLRGNPRIYGSVVDMGPYEATCASYAPGTILYVDGDAAPGGDGSSWGSAFMELSDAIDAALSCDDVVELWVAEGTYTPTNGGNRRVSLMLRTGLGVYGGFEGSETMRSQRDPSARPTVLSGEIGAPGNADNTFHVVVAEGTDATAVLDGFTVTGGQADTQLPHSLGAGVFTSSSDLTVRNVRFIGNHAPSGGGGMYAFGDATLTDVVMDGNTGSSGAGIYIQGSPTLTRAHIVNNSATNNGGGVYVGEQSPTFNDVTIEGNTAETGAGMYCYSQESPILTNAIFRLNSATTRGGGMHINTVCAPVLANVLFDRNSATDGGGVSTLYAAPVLTNVTFCGNIATGSGGGMYNEIFGALGVPELINTVMWGNGATTGEEISNVGDAVPSISYSLVGGCGGSGVGWDASYGTDGGNNIDVDPLYVDVYNGDAHLSSGSQAIDAGDNGATYIAATDLDGYPRIVDGTVDMGAYEYAGYSGFSSTMATTATGSDIYFTVEAETLAVMNFTSTTLDSVTVTMYPDSTPPQAEDGTYWALRYYQITPHPSAGTFMTDLTLFYTQDEFDRSGLSDESELHVWVYNETSGEWELGPAAAHDTDANSFTCTGVTEFSMWAFTNSQNAVGVDADHAVPNAFALHQNRPNPFNPTTVIRYDVPESGGRITLRVYDVAGRLVRTLVDGIEAPGEKQVTWNGRNDHGSPVATGVYFYRMTAPGYEMTKKMVLLQ